MVKGDIVFMVVMPYFLGQILLVYQRMVVLVITSILCYLFIHLCHVAIIIINIIHIVVLVSIVVQLTLLVWMISLL